MKITVYTETEDEKKILDGRESATYVMGNAEPGVFGLIMIQKDQPTLMVSCTSNAQALLAELAKMWVQVYCQAFASMVVPGVLSGMNMAFSNMKQAALANQLLKFPEGRKPS